MPQTKVPRKGSAKVLQPFGSVISFGPGGKGRMGHGDQAARIRIGDVALTAAKTQASKEIKAKYSFAKPKKK
jgi:hypothetical protein